MKQNINMFKEWYKLAKPRKSLWFFQFATILIPSVCLLCESLYAAKATTLLAESNYDRALFSIVLVLFFAFLRAFASDMNYRNTFPLIQSTFMNIQKKIFNKIINSKNKNFTNNSKEKLINIVHTDVYDVSAFSDTICTKSRYLISIILTLVFVFLINYKIGFLVILIIIVNYYIINIINNEVAKAKRIVKESVDKDYEVFSELIDSKEVISDLNITNKMKNEYLDINQKFMNAKHLYNTKATYLDNYFFIFYKSVIFAVTLYMLYLLRNNFVDLTLYLVIVSYLTDSVTNSKDLLTIFTELKNAYIATNRVKIILNFDEKEVLEFGTFNKDDIVGNIDLIDVSYNDKHDEFKTPEINNVTLSFKPYKLYLLYGDKGSGKRTIFYLLRRVIKATNGMILLDKINLLDYSKKVQNNNINYLTIDNYLFNKSIIDNLNISNSSLDKIKEYCELVGIYEIIDNLEEKFNSNIDLLNNKTKYLLSLVRLLLMDSEVLMIYEIPNYFNNKDVKEFINLLNMISLKRTVILFSGKKEYKKLVKNVIEVNNGKIKN